MYSLIKRLCDILFSLIAILILSPLFILLIILLKFSAEGEIFYLQKRIGENNKSFMILKFATMLKNSLNMGAGSITLKNDFRVTKIGNILRKTKINELPQLYNILIGDISFVGPRPLVQKTFDAYSKKIQDKIYNIKPGLTGIGSIVFRDEESLISNSNISDPHVFYKNEISPLKGNLEIWYQKNQSFYTDLMLLILTAWIVLFPKSKIYEKVFKDLPIK